MKLTYISILRSLSILVVVFFHVYQYMYVPAHFPETVQMYHDAYFWFNQCVGINIAMPMFTLIAGFLFSYLYDKGKYQELLPLIKKKAMRLLLPYFVFGILMMATTGVPFRHGSCILVVLRTYGIYLSCSGVFHWDGLLRNI